MELEILAQYGIVGIVLLWFMYRLEKILTMQTKAVNNNSKVMIHVVEVIATCPAAKGSSNGKKLRDKALDNLKNEIKQAEVTV